ncbi:hypothetical protein B484DRAFT_428514 [Ochromonadaceae sp. CCMP2298]|nr:hypothetical protein B484DRAFT_428514 [Ochromonadaceae sp. CCMP2298]|mmetsp:Transcript_19938/g.44549  ORF Transcript_19938/g.44549 Transcript_19938/m.44549 type:complete len:654 (+) Transcript_19938:142-2103(+)
MSAPSGNIDLNLSRDLYASNTLSEKLMRVGGTAGDKPRDSLMGSMPPDYKRPSLNELATREFYQQEGWFEEMCETLFKIKYRGTTIKAEVYHGIIHFISCLYCLAVVPQQLTSAGYAGKTTVVAVALTSGIGSIFCGLFANLPFVLAPPTVVTIFHSVFLQQNGMGPNEGNYGVIISGFLLMLFGWRPLGELVRHLIPLPIQVGTAVGIGLLTCLAGSTEINFVETGKYKILTMGPITARIGIAFTGVFIICVAMKYHVKGSFCIAVVVCSIAWWIYDSSFPDQVFALPEVDLPHLGDVELWTLQKQNMPLLTMDLLFLYVLYLNGLVTSLSNLAVLTREDGGTPRGRWVFIMSGFFTVCGGLLTSAPILVSPESSAAIKEGAKTGLSTVVAGILFLFSTFASPIFEKVPSAGTSPVLVMIGLILFQNANRIDWRNVSDSAPAFMVLFFIPFTYSIIQGVILGYVMYISITLCTGELLENFLHLLILYVPSLEPSLSKVKWLQPYLLKKHSEYRSAAPSVRSGGLGMGMDNDSGSDDDTESLYRRIQRNSRKSRSSSYEEGNTSGANSRHNVANLDTGMFDVSFGETTHARAVSTASEGLDFATHFISESDAPERVRVGERHATFGENLMGLSSTGEPLHSPVADDEEEGIVR